MKNSANNQILFDSGKNNLILHSFLSSVLFGIIPIIVFGVLKINSFSLMFAFSVLFGIIGIVIYVKFFYVKFVIFSDRIQIIYPHNRIKEKVIYLGEIELFSMMGDNGDSRFVVKSKGGYKKSLGRPPGIFKGTKILKMYKDRGVKVKILPRNHELELYLQGKIDNLPMTND